MAGKIKAINRDKTAIATIASTSVNPRRQPSQLPISSLKGETRFPFIYGTISNSLVVVRFVPGTIYATQYLPGVRVIPCVNMYFPVASVDVVVVGDQAGSSSPSLQIFICTGVFLWPVSLMFTTASSVALYVFIFCDKSQICQLS